MYFLQLKRKLNLKNPETLDEKIQWLKFNTYYNNPLVKQCADKFAVRDYVKSVGLDSILVPLIAVYDNVDEIDWKNLPNKFVLKWNFGCGFNIICTDKSKMDIEETIKKLKKWGKTEYYLRYAEMQYKCVSKKIICETFLESTNGNVPEDYKVYCFNGEAKYVLVCLERDKGHPKFYFFDKTWQLERYKIGKEAPPDLSIPKPEGIDELFKCATILSKPFPFVRADFYLQNGKVFFGELTFTPHGGYDRNRLPEINKRLGEMVNLHYYKV
jgi:hypothetical protein